MATINLSKLRKVGGDGTSSDISVVGPTSVTAGTVNTYTITDYDDFSIYEVTAVGGTVSRTDATITLNVPTGASGIAELTISRNGNGRVFQIAVGVSGVATPAILYPSTGSANIPNSFVLQGSTFATVPAGISAHESRRFQIARDAGFVDMVSNAVVSTGNKTQYAVSGLSSGVQYFSRIQDTAANGDVSAFSATTSFSVSTQTIQKPTVNSSSGTVDVGATPTFTGSAFVATPVGSDSHVSSSWVVRNSVTQEIVWQSINDSANKNSITLPQGALNTSTSYTIEVQYNGGFSSSMFSDKLTFSTASSFVPDTPGTPFGGGYYVGNMRYADGVYALIVAPKSAEIGTQNRGTGTSYLSAKSDLNGFENSVALASRPEGEYSPARHCRAYTGGGYSDWYMPAFNETELLYRNLKPTTYPNVTTAGVNPDSVPAGASYTNASPAMTTAIAFQSGNAEAFRDVQYWTSTMLDSPNNATVKFFNNGGVSGLNTTSSHRVRPVRKIKISD